MELLFVDLLIRLFRLFMVCNGDRRSVRGENNRSRGLRRGISSRSRGFTRGFRRGFQGTARGSQRGFQGSTRGSRRGFQPRGGNFNHGRVLSRGRVTKYKWRGGRSLHHGKGYRSDVPCPETRVWKRQIISRLFLGARPFSQTKPGKRLFSRLYLGKNYRFQPQTWESVGKRLCPRLRLGKCGEGRHDNVRNKEFISKRMDSTGGETNKSCQVG
ncbi:Myomodulin neuropeptides 1 [Frankliniella fusca]|uniref:Myomodulin neuropeptides 1 n=1 Tax=Frankliniella fusca TaxID=407009 RepID=A0AAE1L9Q4_9NEOP|nr:Myomodulin neuropeptides 1 [Frankliniella fusca]